MPWAATGTIRYPVGMFFTNVSQIEIQDGEARTANQANHITDDGEWRFGGQYHANDL